jgi:hypothetical protein
MPARPSPLWVRRLVPLVFAALLGTGCSRGCARPPAPPAADLDRDTPQDLRGPAVVPGSRFRDEGTIKLTGGTVTVTAGGQTETAAADMVIRFEEESEVLAAADGRVTKERTRVLRDEQETTVRAGGQTDRHTATSPLAGETVESELLAGNWTHRLVGKPPTDRQRAELELLPPPQSAADGSPRGGSSPGTRGTSTRPS